MCPWVPPTPSDHPLPPSTTELRANSHPTVGAAWRRQTPKSIPPPEAWPSGESPWSGPHPFMALLPGKEEAEGRGMTPTVLRWGQGQQMTRAPCWVGVGSGLSSHRATRINSLGMSQTTGSQHQTWVKGQPPPSLLEGSKIETLHSILAPCKQPIKGHHY